MATTVDYIKYVCEQIDPHYLVRYRKMFGEYMVYVNEKPILLVCDNTVYVKKLDCLKELMQDASVGYPYQGSKEHYILSPDDLTLYQAVINVLESVTKVKAKK